jgi:hypothetical protein
MPRRREGGWGRWRRWRRWRPPRRATSRHTPTVAKQYETTEEELKAVIEKLTGIVY